MLWILDKKYLELLMGFVERFFLFDKFCNLRFVFLFGIVMMVVLIFNDVSDLCVSDKISLLRLIFILGFFNVNDEMGI